MMNWIRRPEQSNAETIADDLGLSKTFIQVLLNRGLKEEDVRTIMLEPHKAFIGPELLINSEEAANKIIEYLNNEDAHIVIRADYDVDGITSGYIMGDILNKTGKCAVSVLYPERIEGYGLREAFCYDIIEARKSLGIKDMLVITVDNGITSIDEVELLKENGIEVIITDHHLPKEQLPDCIVVNPHIDKDSPFHHLAGCGVAFKVCQMILKQYDNEPLLNHYMHALAIGTIADMMPMALENIAFCMYGIEQLNSDDCPKGMALLKDYLQKDYLTYSDIGWEIAPRLNACGRMGNIHLASELFFTSDFDDVQLKDKIIEIDEINMMRKDLTKKKTEEASKRVQNKKGIQVSVVPDCKEGLTGVIANRIMEENQRPAIVLTESKDGFKGSIRVNSSYDIQNVLKKEQSNGNIKKYGGHSAAGGIEISKENINSFIESLAKYDLSNYATEEEYTILIDDEIKIKDISIDLLNELSIVPYDKDDFTEPVFKLSIDVDMLKTAPTKSNEDNLWLYIYDETGRKKIWARGLTDKFRNLGNQRNIDIVATLKRDFMNNNRTATLDILDIASR